MARTRPPDRRATIVSAAAHLFAERGFAAVGIDDIGAEVGITGPAIYRHFRGKDALLSAVVLSGVGRFLDALTSVAAGDDAPPELDALVAATVVAALDQPHELGTYVRERRSLSDSARADLVDAERRMGGLWGAVMRAELPDLSDRDLILRQRAVVGELIAIARFPRMVSRPALDALVTRASLSMLRSPASPAEPEPVPEGAAWVPPENRRERILGVALSLFRERGFHGVGMDELGDAAGITGPTVYRYYTSKSDILVAAFERAGVRVVAGAHDAVDGAVSAHDALARLTRSYATVARDNVDLIEVTSREVNVLPHEERERTAARRRELLDCWIPALREVRPDLSLPATTTLVGGALSLVNALVQAPVDPAVSADEAVRLALAYLDAAE